MHFTNNTLLLTSCVRIVYKIWTKQQQRAFKAFLNIVNFNFNLTITNIMCHKCFLKKVVSCVRTTFFAESAAESCIVNVYVNIFIQY